MRAGCEVIRFPVAHELPRAAKRLGIWLSEQESIEVERSLSDYNQIIGRAWNLSAIAATIAAVTGADTDACAEAAREVSQQILEGLKRPV